MTAQEIIEKIRAEIERMRLEAKENCPEQTINRNYTPTQWQAIGEYNAYEIVGLFLSTLESEKTSTAEGLEEEIQNQIYNHFFDLHGIAITGTTAYASVEDMVYIARHFAQWGAEHLKK